MLLWAMQKIWEATPDDPSDRIPRRGLTEFELYSSGVVAAQICFFALRVSADVDFGYLSD